MTYFVKCIFTCDSCLNVVVSIKVEAWHPYKNFKHGNIVLFYLDLQRIKMSSKFKYMFHSLHTFLSYICP